MAWAQGHQDYYAIFDNRSRVGRTEEGERRVAGISILASSQAKTIEGSNRTDEPTLKCGIWFEAASLYISLWLRLRMSANSLTVIADRFALSASSMLKISSFVLGKMPLGILRVTATTIPVQCFITMEIHAELR
jgi:hypothetical protein